MPKLQALVQERITDAHFTGTRLWQTVQLYNRQFSQLALHMQWSSSCAILLVLTFHQQACLKR